MEAHGLSKKQLEKVFKFEGFGNKAGDYWFLGIEEGGGSLEQLRLRARIFDPVEDLHSAEKIGYAMNRYVPTWRIMSRLVMAIQGNTDWRDNAKAQEYQTTKLGRTDGKTFLTELMPLPCPNTGVWPYASICPSRAEYNAMVRPGRIMWLRSEIDSFKPSYVICYGKGNWPIHQEIFHDVHFDPEFNSQILVGKRGGTTIILLRFLSPDLVGAELIDQIANRFGGKSSFETTD